MTPRALRALVATMRELGVLECEGVKLAPLPDARKPLTKADPVAAAKRAEDEAKRILFAASGVMPK